MVQEFSFIPKETNDPRHIGIVGRALRWIIGKFKVEITSITDNYTANTINEFIAADATSGNITITLPDAATFKGYYLNIKKVDSSGNIVTIDGNGSETIDGTATKVISTQYDSVTILSNGTGWYII